MEYLLTIEEIHNLQNRLNNLQQEFEQNNHELKEIMHNQEELSNNTKVVYLTSRNKQILREKEKLKKQLKEAKLIKADEIKFDGCTVMVGTKVTLSYEGDIETSVITRINDSQSPFECITCDSKIGQLILGKKIGETVICNGIKVEIISVEKI